MLYALIFVYGLGAGFLLVRLRRSAPRLRDERLLVVLGWVMLAASLTMAAALLTWQLWLALA